MQLSLLGADQAFYRKARDIRKRHRVHENQENPKIMTGDNSERSGRNRFPVPNDIPLTIYSATSTSGSGNCNTGDSEEDLVRKEPGERITVTKSVLIN